MARSDWGRPTRHTLHCRSVRHACSPAASRILLRGGILLTLALLSGCGTTPAAPPLHTRVDLARYQGVWYEQFRLPNRFQNQCASNVQAHYTLQHDGTVAVANQCRRADGSVARAEGQARMAGAADQQDPARLEVRFAPDWLAWLPWVWGDYRILQIRGDYEYALVGNRQRSTLWLLSRSTQGDPATMQAMLAHAATLGYDTTRLVKTPQHGS